MSYEDYFSFPYFAAIAAAAVAILWFLFSKRETQIDATVTDNNTTEASISASASSVSAGGVYEVFLSFCGIDTRNSFTDFLYTDLVGAGIRTFKDDNELRVGEEISLELLKSIRESKISIPIFSKNYAYSKWCLLELEEMVECHNNGTQMIYPLFYDVDPSDVRNQRGSYEKAFGQHMKKFSKEVVQRWRDALKIVGGFKGLELIKETNGHQGEFVKLVVEDVLMKLKKYKHVPENLVGMDFHIQELMGLLEVDSKEVQIIGIHGMGGLGKTTIATLIYNNLCERFEGHCFLDNIRENSKNIVELQKQLISKILNRKVHESFSSVKEGRNRIKDVVFQKKLLIVLDDVDNISQVNDLMGHQSWFGLQSRIILTTRCKDVLDVIESKCQNEDPCVVYKSYNPKFMENSDSLQLFSKHAFKKDSPLEGYDFLSMGVVSIAAGLPLVLVVLGSTFYTIRDKHLWEDKLRQLKNIPNKDVMETLKFSFDALENMEKQIFLDIACFFIGYNKTRPCYMWESCGFYPRTAISVLVSRSLITVDDRDELRMHDQLRDLGRQIVREEGLRNNNSAEQSRLWCSEEAMQILKTHQGTSSINSLRFETREIVEATYFHNLSNLRYLVMEADGFYGDFNFLLPNLRWFQCAAQIFSTSNLKMNNLVILELHSEKLTDDWNGWAELKKANNLKVLDLSWCINLKTLPNVSNLTKLVELKLTFCEKLMEIQGFEELQSLIKLEGLQETSNLEVFDVSFCKNLRTLPNLSNLRKLVELKLSDCAKIIEIQGLEKLESLKTLDARNCKSLIRLEGLQETNNLKFLYLASCINLQTLPNLSNLTKLVEFELTDCHRLIDIQGLEKLESLKIFDAEGCGSLMKIGRLEGLIYLERLDLNKCNSLKGFGDLSKLNKLKVLKSHGLDTTDFSHFKILKEMVISYTNSIEIQGIATLESLEVIRLKRCHSLERISDLPNFGILKKISISDCDKLQEVEGLGVINSLESLSISDCHKLQKLPNLQNLKKLKSLKFEFLELISEIHGVEELKSLEELDIFYCVQLAEIPDLESLKNLRILKIAKLEKLIVIHGLEELKSLQSLTISDCKSIEALPDLSALEKLKDLDISGCVKLHQILGIRELKCLTKLDILGCEGLDYLPDLPNVNVLRGEYPTSRLWGANMLRLCE